MAKFSSCKFGAQDQQFPLELWFSNGYIFHNINIFVCQIGCSCWSCTETFFHLFKVHPSCVCVFILTVKRQTVHAAGLITANYANQSICHYRKQFRNMLLLLCRCTPHIGALYCEATVTQHKTIFFLFFLVRSSEEMERHVRNRGDTDYAYPIKRCCHSFYFYHFHFKKSRME